MDNTRLHRVVLERRILLCRLFGQSGRPCGGHGRKGIEGVGGQSRIHTDIGCQQAGFRVRAYLHHTGGEDGPFHGHGGNQQEGDGGYGRAGGLRSGRQGDGRPDGAADVGHVKPEAADGLRRPA